MLQVPSYGLLGKASAAHSARAVGWRWFWVAPFGGGRVLPRQCVELGPRVRVQGMRVFWLCARWAGISVTLSELQERRAEQAERAGRGGAERSAEQPLPASADPGPRPGSMDRSSLLQLIQEQVRGGWKLALPWRPSSR